MVTWYWTGIMVVFEELLREAFEKHFAQAAPEEAVSCGLKHPLLTHAMLQFSRDSIQKFLSEGLSTR